MVVSLFSCECTSSNVYRLRAVRQAQTFGPDKVRRLNTCCTSSVLNGASPVYLYWVSLQALYTCVHESGCHPGSNPFAFGACAHYSCYFEMVESLCASLVTPTYVAMRARRPRALQTLTRSSPTILLALPAAAMFTRLSPMTQRACANGTTSTRPPWMSAAKR